MMYLRSQPTGFTLIETLVAISILLITIVGPMQISSTAARSTSFSSEQVVAFFLAQEGAEIVQKVRDDMILNNFLDPSDSNYVASPWSNFTNTSGPSAPCYTATGCGIELTNLADGSIRTPVACSTSSCRLYYNAAGERARYTYIATGNVLTDYSRVIKLEMVNADQVKVISQVFWQSGVRRQVQVATVETYLFNVYGN